MHILLGIIGLAAAAYFLVMRARSAADMTHELLDVADDIRAAARRFRFRRGRDTHPVEDVDDPRLALAGVATAFIALDDLPTADTRRKLTASLSRHLDVTASDAQDMARLAQWLVEQSGGATSGFSRLARRQYKLNGTEDFDRLLEVLKASASQDLSTRQRDALQDLKRVFRIA